MNSVFYGVKRGIVVAPAHHHIEVSLKNDFRIIFIAFRRRHIESDVPGFVFHYGIATIGSE